MRPELRPRALLADPAGGSAKSAGAWPERRWRDLNPREGCDLNPLSRSSDARLRALSAWLPRSMPDMSDQRRTVEDENE